MKPYYQDDAVTLYHGDCREILPTISGADLVITDPPYSFGLASTAMEGKSGGWGDLMNNAMFYALILREAHRLTENRSGAAWVFNSWRSIPTLMRASWEAKWAIESLLVWDKGQLGPSGMRGLRSSYELVALFCQPAFQLTNRGLADVKRVPWAGFKPSGHPAEKPLDLLLWLIEHSIAGTVATMEADRDLMVLDPFTGSGTTLVAAKALGCHAIGIEVEERWCEVAATRLSQDVLPLESVS